MSGNKVYIRKIIKTALPALFALALMAFAAPAFAADAPAGSAPMPLPKFTMGLDAADSPKDVALSLQLIFLLTVLTLAPSILIMMTPFTRIVIVLSLTRNALGTQQMPPNQVLAGIALFLSFFIMAPVFKQVNDQALQPYLKKEITHAEALKTAEQPMREFMFKQTRKKDLGLFISLARVPLPKEKANVPTYVLIPAYITSELKSAFEMAFIIYVPFLVIDMVIASALMSMGMMMLPPIMISLPFKLLVFVMIDGWNLMARALVLSFNF